MIDLGTVKPGATLYIPFATFASAGNSVTLTGLVVGDIRVYKDGGTTERASTSGFTLLDSDGIDFDGRTGIHGFSINLSDNTTAGFWAAGSRYFITVDDITVDAQTVRFVAATFRIGTPGAILDTTVQVVASQTSMTITEGPEEDDAINGCAVYLHDVASPIQGGFAYVLDYTGATSYSIDTSTKINTTNDTVDVSTASGLADTTQVHWVAGSGTLPAPFVEGTTYYVRDRSGNTLKLAASSGGAAIDITSTGSGTVTLRRRGIVTLQAATTFTVATTDNVAIFHPTNVYAWFGSVVATPTVAGVPEVDATHRLGSALSGAEATAGDIADAVWDEASSGHTTSGTYGELFAGVRQNTAQAGGTSTQLILDTGASASDDFYNGCLAKIVAGTGAGQRRWITDYVGASKICTVDAAWITNPDATSKFVVM